LLGGRLGDMHVRHGATLMVLKVHCKWRSGIVRERPNI
jgi:hypothetical protein